MVAGVADNGLLLLIIVRLAQRDGESRNEEWFFHSFGLLWGCIPPLSFCGDDYLDVGGIHLSGYQKGLQINCQHIFASKPLAGLVLAIAPTEHWPKSLHI